MLSYLLKCGLNRPAIDEPSENRGWWCVEVGAQEGLRLGGALGGSPPPPPGPGPGRAPGGTPVCYRTPLRAAMGRGHGSPPYHSGIRIVVQTVVRDERSWVSLGSL